MMEPDLHFFVNQAKHRSRENQDAFLLLCNAKHYGVAIGMLRQELDSLLRVCYLARPETPLDNVRDLLHQSANGQEWKKTWEGNGKQRLTDREMVNLANHLGGWEKVVYDFGCKLIHLSDFHLYLERDPLNTISSEEKQEIIGYLKFYHQYPNEDLDFNQLAEYLPAIMEKISGNLEYWIEDLLVRFGIESPDD